MNDLAVIEQYVVKTFKTKAHWQQHLFNLAVLNNNVQFLIGDAIIAGTILNYVSGDKYDEAERITGIPKKTLKQYVWVCKKIAPDKRNPELGFTAHKQVANLPPIEQEELLTRANEENLSNEGLREAIKELDPEPEPVQVQDIDYEPVEEPKTINDLAGDLVNLPAEEKTSIEHIDYLIEEAQNYLNDGLYLDEFINLLKEYRRENF
jgi:hypothetical protein